MTTCIQVTVAQNIRYGWLMARKQNYATRKKTCLMYSFKSKPIHGAAIGSRDVIVTSGGVSSDADDWEV